MTIDPDGKTRPAELIVFGSREAMADRLAELVQAVVAGAVGERGEAALALSGGSTPALLYKRLSATHPDLWSKADVTLVDERWTPPGADGSNETFIREALGVDENPPRRFLGLWSEAPAPEDGAAAASAQVAKLKSPLDVAILGMGDDGHTASWFPHAQGLEDALSHDEKVVHVRAKPSAVTGDHLDRLTLTLGAVANAKLICLVLHGGSKRATFETVLEDGPIDDMPVRAILRARPDLWVCWAP